MFKKIEIWILYLIVLLSIPITIVFGYLVRYEINGGKKFGQLSKTALFLTEIPNNIKRALTDDLIVEDRFPLLNGFNGTSNSSESYLLLSRYDGDLRDGIIELIDLTDFKILHTWNPDIDEFNKSIKKIDEFKYLVRDNNDSRNTLKHPKLNEDGSLTFTTSVLRKVDACSNLIFQKYNDIFHHSIETDLEKNYWVPSRLYPQSLPVEKVGRKIIEKGGYIDDAVVKLSPEGKILFEKSVSKILIDNGLESLLFASGDWNFTKDPIHLNDIQPVNVDGKFWKKGDLFLSLRNLSMILLYRPSTNKIIWKGTGPFFNQHDVDLLNDHSISIFNNNVKVFQTGLIVDGHNEVIVYDFSKDEYSPYLNDSLIQNDVRTVTGGQSQILQNGDLLVEESNFGRLLYFNSDGSLRWTYVNKNFRGNTFRTDWVRILIKEEDIKMVGNFLKLGVNCD